jgi:oligoendopeptidase F
MTSDYPFDPYDWTTITPLFVALQEAPVTRENFGEWLEKWNRLEIDVYDAVTTLLKRPAYYDTNNHAAERAYQAFYEEFFSTHRDLENALIRRALSIQPNPPAPAYQQLWRRWRNQISFFDPRSLPIHQEINRLDGLYRGLMNGYEGTANNPHGYWMDRRAEVNDLMLNLLKHRRALARGSGFATFLEYRWCELNRFDYSITDCQAFHRAVEKMVPAIAELRSGGLHDVPSPEVEDVEELADGAERILRRVDPSFGNIFHAMRDGNLDLGHRPNKVISFESWFFPRSGIPYIHVASGNAGSVFHESGHGIHECLSFQTHGSLWNFAGPEEFQEFAAASMDMLCWPYYGLSQGGLYTDEECALARQSVLGTYLGMTDSVMNDAFEHWVYGEESEGMTSDDLDAKWLELKQRFEPWDDDYAGEDEKKTGWQRGTFSLFRMPLYMITYPMATVGACQMGLLAEAHRTDTIRNYKKALVLGNTRTLPELFKTAGVCFPFDDLAVEDTINFIRDQFRS